MSAAQESYVRYVEDIVLAPKRVIEYTVHRHYCGTCKTLVHALIPDALPGMRIGLTTMLYVLSEHNRNKATDDAIVESLATFPPPPPLSRRALGDPAYRGHTAGAHA